MASDSPHHFVLDVNLIVSAYIFPQSVPGQALDLVLSKYQLLMSLDLAAELADVVRRSKFDRYLSVRRREELLAGTVRNSHFIEITSSISDCRDPLDNKLLELAVDGRAEAIVSGDADLLVLHPLILSPRQYLLDYTATETT